MPLETRVRIEDLLGNPKCNNCYGRGWVWRTLPGKKRDAAQCGCAKAVKTITRAVAE